MADKWILVNISTRTVSTGILGVRTVPPGKSTDLLATVSKDDVRQSIGIKNLLQLSWARIDKYSDDVLVTTVTGDNLTDLYDTPIVVDNSDQINLGGKTMNLNVGVGQGGGDVNLEGGALSFNNDVSLTSSGTVISANCSELVTANDFTCFGTFTAVGNFILPLPDEEPTLLQNGAFSIFEENGQIILKAQSNDGKSLRIILGNFT